VIVAVFLKALQAAGHGADFNVERQAGGGTLERQKQGWPTHRGFLRWVGVEPTTRISVWATRQQKILSRVLT
jgi:hypothetical protein